MSKKIVLKNIRISYPHLFTAQSAMDGVEPKYSAAFLMPANHPQVAEFKKAIAEAAKEKFPKKVNGDELVGLRSPLRDGAEKDGAEYEGMLFFNASNKRRPTVLDRDKSALADEDGVVYAGCYVNVSLNLNAYDTAGNRGVGAYLNGVQFHRDGDRLDGGSDCFNDFEVEDDAADMF